MGLLRYLWLKLPWQPFHTAGLFYCWVISNGIVALSLAKVTMATIAYCGIVLLLDY
jgi:hypothetical protein